MNVLEQEMYGLLKELKQKHNLSGIKISFEDEGLTLDQAQIISSIAFKADINVSLKIGGCEAIKDLREAKVLGVNKIVAPMIESAYAVKKFIAATQRIFDKSDLDDTKFMINIETISGYKSLEEILNSEEASLLYGIILGRSDFSGSLKKDKTFVDSDELFAYASSISDLCLKYDKKFYVGGNLTKSSLDFIKRLATKKLDGFETRNIIFDGSEIYDTDLENALNKALRFELLWLKNKRFYSDNTAEEDNKRIENIQNRLNL